MLLREASVHDVDAKGIDGRKLIVYGASWSMYFLWSEVVPVTSTTALPS